MLGFQDIRVSLRLGLEGEVRVRVPIVHDAAPKSLMSLKHVFILFLVTNDAAPKSLMSNVIYNNNTT